MRKDVKLGFAVGGVLLAVLIVYVSVVGRPNRATTNQPGAGIMVVPGATATNNPTRPPTDATAGEQPNAGGADPFSAQAQNKAGETPSSAASQNVDWDKLLASGPVTSRTPDAQVSKGAISTPTGNTPPPSDNTTSAASNRAVSLVPTFDPAPTGNTTTTTNSGSRTHVIQKGETLSSIALAAYGSAHFFPAIVKANPGLDPNHLKLNSTIVLPDLSQVKATVKPVAAQQTETAVGADEYRVAAGDNLYKISMKLYGKGDRADKIYQLNKSRIGADPAKLKLNMLLKLPEKPTAAR